MNIRFDRLVVVCALACGLEAGGASATDTELHEIADVGDASRAVRDHVNDEPVGLRVSLAADASAPSQNEAEILSGLLSWAVKLSSYPAPAAAPRVEFVSQDFFDENACHHRKCHVWGWYPNTGGSVVYVHEAVRSLIADGSDPKSLLAASIIVHEFIHYLQAANRSFAPYKCEESLQLEREAYKLQAEYIVGYGRYIPIGVSMHGASCAGSASANVIGEPAEATPEAVPTP